MSKLKILKIIIIAIQRNLLSANALNVLQIVITTDQTSPARHAVLDNEQTQLTPYVNYGPAGY